MMVTPGLISAFLIALGFGIVNTLLMSVVERQREFTRGEFIAIMGPSGSGKTTLLNMLGGLDSPVSGSVVITEREITKMSSNARAMELLEAVGLKERADARPAKLSGGQQQRVAVVRALASKPAFVLADEPTANLAGKSAEMLPEIMEKLNCDENITFIFSTHDPRIMARARRIITLEDGKVEEDKKFNQK